MAKKQKPAKKQGGKKPAKAKAEPPKIVRLNPAGLSAYPELQMRAGGIDPAHVERLREQVRDGAKLDPIKAVELPDGNLAVVDGFHSRLAYIAEDAGKADVLLVRGTMTDALLAACAANKGHKPNLPRTDEDKRKAVRVLQETLAAAGLKWSENQQAKHLGVSRGLLQVMREGRRSASIKPESTNGPEPAASHDAGPVGGPDGVGAGETGGVGGGVVVPGPGVAATPPPVPEATPDPITTLDIPDDLRERLTRDGVATLAELVRRLEGGETFDLSDDELGGLHVLCGLPEPGTDPDPPAAPAAAIPAPPVIYRPCPYLKPDGSHRQCDDPRQCRVCGGKGGVTEEEYGKLPPKVRATIDGQPLDSSAHPFDELMAAITGLARRVTLAMNAEGGERLKTYLTHAGLVEHRDKVIDGRHYGASFVLLRGLRTLVRLAGLPGKEKTKSQIQHEYLADDSADAA